MNEFRDDLLQNPFVRITVPLMIGVFIQDLIVISKLYLLYSLCFLSGTFVIFLLTDIFRKYTFRSFFGILISLLFVFLGMFCLATNKAVNHDVSSDEYIYSGIVTSIPAETASSVKVELDVDFRLDSAGTDGRVFRVLLYFEKDSFSHQLDYGDRLIFRTGFSTVKNSGNPYEFDYKRFLSFADIYSSAYIKSQYWGLLSKNNCPFYLQYPTNIRKELISLFEKNGVVGQEKAILSALTLGYKLDLSNETKNAFSSSGAVHLLAVSGLHVGIVYTILSTLFGKMLRIRNKLVVWFLIASGIWFFTFLTGATPSVRRAALMFTMIALGRSIGRSALIFNIIAASVLVLLINNPRLLFSVGFQLSYLAVISIILFYKPLYSLFDLKNKFLDYCWQVSCVTTAAQIGTLPLILYYFSQFPSYSLLTNLLIIQLAPAIMTGSMVFFLTSFSTFVAGYIGVVISFFAFLMSKITSWIEKLPFSVITDISVSKVDVVGMFLIILFVAYYIYYRNKKTFIAIGFVVMMLVGYNFIVKFGDSTRQRFVVYNINKASFYLFQQHKMGFCLVDNQVFKKPEKHQRIFGRSFMAENLTHVCFAQIPTIDNKDDTCKFLYRGGFTSYNIEFEKTIRENFLDCHKNIVFFGGKTFCFINDDNIFKFKNKEPVQVDFVVLGKNIRRSYKELSMYFEPNLVIIDPEVSIMQKNIWLGECSRLNVRSYAVADEGAFILDF